MKHISKILLVISLCMLLYSTYSITNTRKEIEAYHQQTSVILKEQEQYINQLETIIDTLVIQKTNNEIKYYEKYYERE